MAAHLEKVLKHAEEKLMLSSGDRPVDQLDLYRNFFKIEEHRLLLAHRAGEGGLALAAKRSDLFSVVLKHVFEGALRNAGGKFGFQPGDVSFAMAAVGGFGREEMCPHSDIDLLFLYESFKKGSPKAKFIHEAVEQVLYLLWDIGLKVGHASRTIDEAIAQGKEDFQTLTALLDIRLLAGDEALLNELEIKFEKDCLGPLKNKYLHWRLEDQSDRHRKNDGTVFVQEPHVKNGCGGLRDYQNLLWVARLAGGYRSLMDLQKAGYLKASQRKHLLAAYDFLLRVRNELHYQSERSTEMLTLRAQGEVSTELKYPQESILRRTEALMKDYYGHSHQIFHICNLLARRLAGESPPKKGLVRRFLTRKLNGNEQIDGFTLDHGVLHVPSTRFFAHDPRRIVRAFQIMQQRDAELHPETEARIHNRARLLTRKELRSHREYAEMLFHILRQKGSVGRIIRMMHRNGVLGRLIPEFAPLTFLVQHEFYHRYTADEHTIVCLEQLDMVLDRDEAPYKAYRYLFEECARPELLYLALILHDVGKADNTGQHEAASVQKAVKFARRMRITGERLAILTFLVDHHGSLNAFACRRNLEDPKTIQDFARLVQTRERLQMLMLMSFSDTQGTGDQSWSNWKEGLVWHLYRQTDAMLDDGEEFKRQQLAHQQQVKEATLKELSKIMSQEEADAHFQSLPDNYLNYPHETLIIQQMTVAHRFIVKQIEDGDPARILAPEIHWENRPLVDCSEVSIATWDREQLFSKICGAFTVTGLIIMSADIWTREDNIVIDTFRVCTERLTAASHKRDQSQFTEILEKCLIDPEYDLHAEVLKHGKNRQVEILDEDILKPALGLDNESSDRDTVLHIRASDRMGLLYIISSCISRNGYRIINARISTEKGAALDAFYLRDGEGNKIRDREAQNHLIRELSRSIREFIS